jgi:hypothetical protein
VRQPPHPSLRDCFAVAHPSAAASIKMLLAFVNWEYWELSSDTMRDCVFPLLYLIEGQPATSGTWWTLHARYESILIECADGQRPRSIDCGATHMRRERDGRFRPMAGGQDLNDHLSLAVNVFLKARRTVRRCVVCESFFLPKPRQKACSLCRTGPAEVARRLALSAARVRKHREPTLASRRLEREKLPREQKATYAKFRAAEDCGDYGDAKRCAAAVAAIDKRLIELHAHPPPVPEHQRVQILIGTPDQPIGPDLSPLVFDVAHRHRSVH